MYLVSSRLFPLGRGELWEVDVQNKTWCAGTCRLQDAEMNSDETESTEGTKAMTQKAVVEE